MVVADNSQPHTALHMKSALAAFKKEDNARLRAATEAVDTGSTLVTDTAP